MLLGTSVARVSYALAAGLVALNAMALSNNLFTLPPSSKNKKKRYYCSSDSIIGL